MARSKDFKDYKTPDGIELSCLIDDEGLMLEIMVRESPRHLRREVVELSPQDARRLARWITETMGKDR